MSPKNSSHSPEESPQQGGLPELLGYLNFSNGTPDPAFQQRFNAWYASLPAGRTTSGIRDALLQSLSELKESTPAFADATQAESVIHLLFDDALPAYREHHCDLLFHLQEDDFLQPFFLVRLFEIILSIGSPWDEIENIVQESMNRLNLFLGHRPLAVLENEQQMQPYAHERFRPVPIYLREVGVAFGKYQELIERTIEFFRQTPQEILEESCFDLALMDELAVDVRAHDHTHPMNKRTNYIFGEWDPHQIDNQGRYRRFVIRRFILDALLDWMDSSGLSREESLYDASAVLCGTMLMASSISGSGPDSHDSSVTLTSLLPRVAHQRDAFYARLLSEVTGERSERLRQQAELTQQPFGHVRKELNLRLSAYGARQLQCRQIAYLFARMGFATAARDRAAEIPSVSARIECEIQWRITTALKMLDHAKLSESVRLIREIEDYLHRGIECGALPDPWNILGFQGHYPLFSSREDSLPDQRIEILLDIMEQIFALYSRTMAEAAVEGDGALSAEISDRFLKLAEFWDQFATTAVSDLPDVAGREAWESATGVSLSLQDWRVAGESAGDISFWSRHVDRFESAAAYAQVVESLLQKKDHVAAMGLMMQWLSQAEDVGLEAGTKSIHIFLVRWLRLVIQTAGENTGAESIFGPTVRRLFDYLEANAGEFWNVPTLASVTDVTVVSDDGEFSEEWDEESLDESSEEDEDNLFGAAYEGVVYRDSADDGNIEDTLDSGYAPLNTEFEIIYRELEPRLKFLETLSELWGLAATTWISHEVSASNAEGQIEAVQGWYEQVVKQQKDLVQLMNAIAHYEIGSLPGDADSNMEFDAQLQTKYFLLHSIMNVCLRFRMTQWHLLACLPSQSPDDKQLREFQLVAELCRSLIRDDVVAVRRQLPMFLRRIAKKPLLYVSLENGGSPQQVLSVRTTQVVLRFLLEHLPRLGLLHETWNVINAAFRMERGSRPSGSAVTEFDRLFKSALKNTLQSLVRSVESWRGKQSLFPLDDNAFHPQGRFVFGERPVPADVIITSPGASSQPIQQDEELVTLTDQVVRRYHKLWLRYSRGIRLSRVEELNNDNLWNDVVDFVTRYGSEMFNAANMTLGNVRSILHGGVDSFLDYLDEHRDPLKPIQFLDDLDQGRVEISHAVRMLEVIFESYLDKLDRFVEYNTTTTQSDYGELFYYLLDFMRVETSYERDAWNFQPYVIAHETLSESQRNDVVLQWEEICRDKVGQLGDKHIKKLHKLEAIYGMQLPSVSDLLNERFVKGLAVNRMQSLIPRVVEENRQPGNASRVFALLRKEIDDYLATTTGSAFDIPQWLQSLEETVSRNVENSQITQWDRTTILNTTLLRRRQLLKRLSDWK